MKKKIKRFFIYINFLILFSGCTNLIDFGFDLYELAHFRKDGSGKFEMIFSLDRISRLMTLGEYMAQDHIEFSRLLIQDAFLATGETLGSIPGITKVTNIHDDTMLHFKLTFEFKNISALNKAMAQIYMNVDPVGVVYFKMNEHAFVRTHTEAIPKLVEYYQDYDDSLTKSFDLPFFFRNMQYIIRYSFSEEIRKATNPLATISKDQKNLTIIHRLFDKKQKGILANNRIFFKTNAPVRKQTPSSSLSPHIEHTKKNINENRKLQSH
jgi:hypothetical protein